jgi:hypothetical protein
MRPLESGLSLQYMRTPLPSYELAFHHAPQLHSLRYVILPSLALHFILLPSMPGFGRFWNLSLCYLLLVIFSSFFSSLLSTMREPWWHVVCIGTNGPYLLIFEDAKMTSFHTDKVALLGPCHLTLSLLDLLWLWDRIWRANNGFRWMWMFVWYSSLSSW